MNNKEIGMRIKSKREERGLILDELASKIGMTKSTISRYEAGSIENIKLPVIESIAKALNINPMWLIGKSESEEPKEKIESYYINPETAELAEKLKNNKELAMVFDAAKNATPEDLQFVYDMIVRLKKGQ